MEPITRLPESEALRVLVVDDHHDAAASMAMLLRLRGHHVLTASDGAQAIKLAAESAPDAILLDLAMPIMSGYEVICVLRQKPEMKDTLIVAVSGYSGADQISRALEAGFDAYLGKPTSFEDVIALLMNYRKQRAVRRQESAG